MGKVNLLWIKRRAQRGGELLEPHEMLTMVKALEKMAREIAGHQNSRCEVGFSFDKDAEDILGEHNLTMEDKQ